ncbi:coiled coil domain-containing protein [Shewanella sp. S1-49-MNA-CIBAN-0167]|uniref:coiled coil domain-containing protein n=1 Tax=Shewanella sp. S1-49-MNA-CIBAN-0167 TaxID=3140468 RepID=UPI003328BBD2
MSDIKSVITSTSALIGLTTTKEFNHEQERSLPKKLRAQLDQWSAEIDKLKAKADNAEADAKIEYYKQIEELRTMQKSANSKLTELKESSDGAWEELKAGMDGAWNSLGNSLKSATSRFK